MVRWGESGNTINRTILVPPHTNQPAGRAEIGVRGEGRVLRPCEHDEVLTEKSN